ncbi:MAG: hypothetical protein ABJH72_20150 [Reichenbachiella sp.]|uniref:hypothetical protein n=1 Tax=Reichenbachiella sp. TaxID=2184521 RepID=UPI003266287D
MYKLFYAVALMLLFNCQGEKSKTTNNAQSKYGPIEKAVAEIDSLLKLDDRWFWGHDLYGPIIFIDPETREFAANQNSSSGQFRKENTVYLGTLPDTYNIANTAINWEGKRWTMVMLPLPTDQYARNNLIIHELFHRIQPAIGFDSLQEISNAHLDTYEARVLLILELEALKNALISEDISEKNNHIKNALNFRSARHISDKVKSAENALEMNEGLAEYTGAMLSGRSDAEMKLHFKSKIENYYASSTFVRSFAYQTIPVYGFFLSKRTTAWQREITENTNLTDYFVRAFSAEISEDITFDSIIKMGGYDNDAIIEKEQNRERNRLAKEEMLRKKYLEEPTLKLNFKKMNISFNPANIIPLGELGTVYPTMRITDHWGILEVENGALLDANWGFVMLSAPTLIEAETVTGDGWTLQLNEMWEVTTAKEQYQLKKK